MEVQDGYQDGHGGHGKYRNGLNFIICMHVCHPNNNRGDVSMAIDVCKSKIAAKVATTNMKITKITITSSFNSLRNVFLVYAHVLSPREYEWICVSMANDVYKSKMAANIATTNMNKYSMKYHKHQHNFGWTPMQGSSRCCRTIGQDRALHFRVRPGMRARSFPAQTLFLWTFHV